MFSSDTTLKPRSRYSMDFQGQGRAITGETEAPALIDSFTKTVIIIPLPDRKARQQPKDLINTALRTLSKSMIA